MEAEVDDATAQLVEHVMGLFSAERDVRGERDYLEGAVRTYASEREAHEAARAAVGAALTRLGRASQADLEGAARRRLVAAVQHDDAISPVYRGLICAAIGAIEEGFEFDARATEPDEGDAGIGGIPILYPRVEFGRDRTTFETRVALRSLLSAAGWAALNAQTTRAPLPVPPSAIGAGLFGWLRRKGVARAARKRRCVRRGRQARDVDGRRAACVRERNGTRGRAGRAGVRYRPGRMAGVARRPLLLG